MTVEMNCRNFEALFEQWLDGSLSLAERDLCARHLAGCSDCRELEELGGLTVDQEVPPGLAPDVLEQTTGAVCERIELRLPELVDGLLGPGTSRDLLREHIAHCDGCSGLVAELERLATDLPQLAVIPPEKSLVDDVLWASRRASLPLPVRLRRWRTQRWPQWVSRPRFALESAYAVTVVLLVLVGTPVSPLQAMPQKALELVRTAPLDRLDDLQATAQTEVSAAVRDARDELSRRADDMAVQARERLGTIFEKAASWFESDDTDAHETDEQNEETS